MKAILERLTAGRGVGPRQGTWLPLLVLLAALALAAGACAEDDDATTESAPPATNTTTTTGEGAATGSRAQGAQTPGAAAAGKTTLYSIDIINGQPVPKSGPVTVSGPQFTMGGWAVDQQAQTAAGGVVVVVDGKTEVPTQYGTERKDVADAHKNPRYQNSGFAASISTASLGKGRHTLGLKILTADRKSSYEPAQKIEVDVQ